MTSRFSNVEATGWKLPFSNIANSESRKILRAKHTLYTTLRYVCHWPEAPIASYYPPIIGHSVLQITLRVSLCWSTLELCKNNRSRRLPLWWVDMEGLGVFYPYIYIIAIRYLLYIDLSALRKGARWALIISVPFSTDWTWEWKGRIYK